MTKRTRIIAVATGIVLTAGVVWAVMRSGPDPEVEKVKQMQAELFKPGATPDPAKLTELRKAEKQLSPAQQQELGRDRGERFQQRMKETVAAYYALPPEKRKDYLDEQIKTMEKWRKAREAERGPSGQGGPPGGGGGPGGPGGPGSADMRAMRGLQRLDGTSATQRAQFQNFMADMNQRRSELGLPPMGRRPLPSR